MEFTEQVAPDADGGARAVRHHPPSALPDRVAQLTQLHAGLHLRRAIAVGRHGAHVCQVQEHRPGLHCVPETEPFGLAIVHSLGTVRSMHCRYAGVFATKHLTGTRYILTHATVFRSDNHLP